MMTMPPTTNPRPCDSSTSRITTHAEIQTLQIAIRDALSHTGYRELRNLNLECNGEAVTISGRVSTYYLKQLVQSLALAAPGVRRVQNDVQVG